MNQSHSGLRTAAVFALGALFAVLSVGLTLLSSGVYRSTAADGAANSAQRTALSYLVNQTRRADEDGCIDLGSFGGVPALRLSEHLDGATYYTYLYCYDGQLRELYTEAGTGLGPADGQAVLPAQALDVQAEDGAIRFTVTTADGAVHTAALSPRTGFGEVGEL